MDQPDQATLKKLWTSGRHGTLCPMELMKAWGIAWAMKHHYKDDVNYEAIAGAVVKIGGGSPSREAIRKLCNRIDSDPDWFPGVKAGDPPGPKKAISALNQANIARSAMAQKKEGGLEPTYKMVLAKCPTAVLNPETGRPVGKKRIYDIFREQCYDETPERSGSISGDSRRRA